MTAIPPDLLASVTRLVRAERDAALVTRSTSKVVPACTRDTMLYWQCAAACEWTDVFQPIMAERKAMRRALRGSWTVKPLTHAECNAARIAVSACKKRRRAKLIWLKQRRPRAEAVP